MYNSLYTNALYTFGNATVEPPLFEHLCPQKFLFDVWISEIVQINETSV